MSTETPELTVADLQAAGLNDQFDAIQSAVETHLDGKVANIAVISEPFAGREIFLDYAESEFGAATGRITFDEVLTDGLPEFPNAEIVLVDNCQYLYQRQIGGFETLQSFLDHIATRDALYVTSWNRYAWTYLSAITDVGSAFPETIQIPRLDASQIGQLLQSYHGTPLPMFTESEEAGRLKTVDLSWESKTVGGVSVSVPHLELNTEYVLSRSRTNADVNVEGAVYQRIAKLSEGDPGVATALWEQSIDDDTISPRSVEEVSVSLETDRDEAFVLEVILTNEQIALPRLKTVCEDIDVNQALQTLITYGVVKIDDDNRARIEPTRLGSMVDYLTRRQLVW